MVCTQSFELKVGEVYQLFNSILALKLKSMNYQIACNHYLDAICLIQYLRLLELINIYTCGAANNAAGLSDLALKY